MSRADLLALTPEALASLSNLGLVKRAQRDLASGISPQISEESDGTVIGAFADGVVARLPKGATLKDAPCTCGATSVCRHRVSVALAYKPWHVEQREGAAPPSSARVPTSWSPREIDDATLEKALGHKTLERARAALKKGLLVTLDPLHEGTPPTARLPSCTVRFLVPRDFAYARCDCALAGGACEHLALAVWAFRESKDDAQSTVLALGNVGDDPARDGVLDDALNLVREILAHGVADTPASPARFASLRARLEKSGMTWVHAIVIDLEIALEGYRKRSALYGTREVNALLTELAARVRAGRAGTASELPARFVLGEDEARETLLDHLRLVSLGARVRADERTRFADVYFADPDTAQVLVLRKRWDFDEKTTPQEGPALASRPMAARATLAALAHGQIVSKVVTRHANRSIDLGTSRVAQTSITPQRGDYASLPPGLLVRDLKEHAERLKLRPPRMLRPRVLAEEVRVVAIGTVDDVMYSAADQRLIAFLTDEAGHRLVLALRHRRVAPFAIEATAATLAQKVRFIAGDLSFAGGEWQIDPLAIAADALVVLDLANTTPAPNAPSFTRHAHPDPIDEALRRAESCLDEQSNAGVATPARAALERANAVAQALDDVGLNALAARFRVIATASSPALRPDAWLDASLRLTLTRDAT